MPEAIHFRISQCQTQCRVQSKLNICLLYKINYYILVGSSGKCYLEGIFHIQEILSVSTDRELGE